MKKLLWLLTAALFASQWIILRIAGIEFSPFWVMLISGLAIFGSAFLLSWSAELAQLEIPQSLAIAAVALLAVLPEYAVDMYFAWSAGKDLAYAPYAVANMTGANRLLIGLGWAAVVFCAWLKSGQKEIQLELSRNVEIRYLILATLYSFLIPLKGAISLIDSVFLLWIFFMYLRSSARSKMVEPQLEKGPAKLIGQLPRTQRNLIALAMAGLGGFSIFFAAEPFAENLLQTAEGFGIEKFLLVQWIAPLASEAPEFIVAILFTLRSNAGTGIGTLLSSKVNQWTLLVGMIPIVFSWSGYTLEGLPLDSRQREELFLTSAQSIFAVVVLVNLSFSLWEAALIFLLFSTQLFFPQIRNWYAFLYFIFAIGWLIIFKENRIALFALFKKPR